MKKLSLFSSLFVLVFFSCQKEIDNLNATDQDEMMQKAYESCNILANFKEAIENKLVRSSSDVVYPTYFGGTYLDEEKNPVILTTDMAKQGLIKEIAGSDVVIVKPCTYSYQYLHDIDNRIKDCLRKRPELLGQVGINRFGVIIDENCIDVTLVSCTPEKINLFKSLIIDESVIRFSEDPSIMMLASASTDSLAKVTSKASGTSASPLKLPYGQSLVGSGIGVVIGYRAKNGSIQGYVSSGHVAELVGGALTDLRFNNPKPVGRIVAVYTSFEVDASFCQIYDDSGIEIIPFLDRVKISSFGMEPQKNAPISIKRSRGVVTRESIAVTYRANKKWYTIYDCGEATYLAHDTDSGSVAYLDYGDHDIFGIHVGYNNSINRAYFCKARNINTAFGLTMY